MNKHFIEIGPKSVQIPTTDVAPLNIQQCSDVFEFCEDSPFQVYQKLPTSKASGLDNIPVRLWKLINFATIVSLTYIINTVICKGTMDVYSDDTILTFNSYSTNSSRISLIYDESEYRQQLYRQQIFEKLKV